MKKILELLFCMVALIALLIFTQNADKVENVETNDALVAASSDIQSPVGDNVALLECQK